MGFLDRIFKKLNPEEPNPTLEWGEYRGMELVVVPDEMRVGRLKFGDPLSAAEFLGKPSRFAWGHPGYCELEYAQGGFQLDFDHERLVLAAFYLDHHAFEPEGEFAFSSPVVVLSGGNGSSCPTRRRQRTWSKFSVTRRTSTNRRMRRFCFSKHLRWRWGSSSGRRPIPWRGGTCIRRLRKTSDRECG